MRRKPDPNQPRMLAALCAAVWVWSGAALGQSLPDGAEALGKEQVSPGQMMVATGPWSRAQGLRASRVTGAITTESWQMPAGGTSTLQLADRLTRELEAQGFAIRYSCTDVDCGGFDFRFAIPTLPEPSMHVDLGDFRYIAAEKAQNEGLEYRILLISRAPEKHFVQITSVLPLGEDALTGGADQTPEAGLVTPQTELTGNTEPDAAPVLTEAGALIATLVARGSTPLDDLIFPAGTADLAAGDYASLEELGGWLLENPSVTVALVGHTDATGALSGNIVLSKRRAESVRRWLNAKFNLPAAQVVGEGMGYLAPRATNATPEGQAQNRRVEVIVTSTR
jgi:outer membrane protein OmpA-like peptidoglycan-associated protein